MMKRNLKMMMAAAMMAGSGGGIRLLLGEPGSGAQEESAQSGGTQESGTQGSVAQEGDGQLKVGIIQLIENGAFNDMREGFIQELRAQGYSEDRGLSFIINAPRATPSIFRLLPRAWLTAAMT